MLILNLEARAVKPSDALCSAPGLGRQGKAGTHLRAGSPMLLSDHRGIGEEDYG